MFTFLNTAFLFALPLIGVPVLIHLLNRRRRQTVQWGAMQFLVAGRLRQRRIWRIRDLLLMLMRALALAAIILALAQPFLKTSWAGASVPRDVIIILDRSLSTARLSGQGELFDDLKAKLDDMLGEMDDNDRVRLLLAGTTPQWLFPNAMAVDAETRSRIQQAIANLQPTLEKADLLRALWEAAQASSAETGGYRILAVLTDNQAFSWQPQAEDLWGSFGEQINQQEEEIIIACFAATPSEVELGNLSVNTVRAGRELVGLGERFRVAAEIANTGRIPSLNTTVRWTRNGEFIATSPLHSLQPGQSTTISIEESFDQPGLFNIRAEIEQPDALPDNHGLCLVESIERAPILLVSNDGDVKGDAFYMLAALGYRTPDDPQPWHSIFAPTLVSVAALDAEPLDQYRAVVFLDVLPEEKSTIQRIEEYVRQGGGVWLAPGDSVEMDWFNRLWYRGGEGLAPLPLVEVVGEATEETNYAMIHPPTDVHPVTRLLADTERLDLHKARVYRRFVLADEGGSARIRVLLRTGLGEPLAVERNFGKGRVMLQGMPLGIRWSNLPILQAYVVWVQEWLWHLIEPAMTHWNLAPGETIEVAFPREQYRGQGVLMTPSNTEIELQAQEEGERQVFRYAGALSPGSYCMLLEGRNGGRQSFCFNVARDPRESALAPLEENQRVMLEEKAGVQFADSPLSESVAMADAVHREPVWSWVLIALIGFLALETLLAASTTRARWRSTQAAGVVPESLERQLFRRFRRRA